MKVNLSTVQGLKSLGDPSLFNRLVDVFTETAAVQIKKIEAYAAEKNWAKVSAEAHSLKSSAFSLGAEDLGRLSAALEDKATEVEDKISLINKLPAEFAGAIAELQALRDPV